MKQISGEAMANKEPALRVYQSPAVIYEGTISTRAGSPIGPIAPSDERGVDPVDLFGDDGS